MGNASSSPRVVSAVDVDTLAETAPTPTDAALPALSEHTLDDAVLLAVPSPSLVASLDVDTLAEPAPTPTDAALPALSGHALDDAVLLAEPSPSLVASLDVDTLAEPAPTGERAASSSKAAPADFFLPTPTITDTALADESTALAKPAPTGDRAASSSSRLDADGWQTVRRRRRERRPPTRAPLPPHPAAGAAGGTTRLRLRVPRRAAPPPPTPTPTPTPRVHSAPAQEEDNFFIYKLFEAEQRDPEEEAHETYWLKNKFLTKTTLCLICYLEGKATVPEMGNTDAKAKQHYKAAHNMTKIHHRCKKVGCWAVAKCGRDIGIHQYVCHKM